MSESLSIIVPCLNEQYYIGYLLESLAYQTFQDFEVVIIDGNSTDDTKGSVATALATYGTLRTKVRFIVADARGISHQRNFGVRYAAHAQLLFLDADVQMRPAFLEETLREIAQRQLALATVDFIPLSNRLDDKLLYAIGNGYARLRQYVQPVAMGFCIFSTKKVHTAIGGFSEALRISEDYDYAIRAAKKGFVLKILSHGRIYISVRRLDVEGRFTYYYKKALLPQVYHLFRRSTSGTEETEYIFGIFNKNSDVMHLDLRTMKARWKKRHK